MSENVTVVGATQSTIQNPQINNLLLKSRSETNRTGACSLQDEAMLSGWASQCGSRAGITGSRRPGTGARYSRDSGSTYKTGL